MNKELLDRVLIQLEPELAQEVIQEYEALIREIYRYRKIIEELMFMNLQKEKKLKALEIIKNKDVNIYWLKASTKKSNYNLVVGSKQALSKREYDLLKEVLL